MFPLLFLLHADHCIEYIATSVVHIVFSMVGFSYLLVRAYTDKTLIRLM